MADDVCKADGALLGPYMELEEAKREHERQALQGRLAAIQARADSYRRHAATDVAVPVVAADLHTDAAVAARQQAWRLVERWTGAEASALRRAMRLPVREFAEHLGVSARQVDTWNTRGADITLRPEIQRALDTALARAADEVKTRFSRAVGVGDRGLLSATSSPVASSLAGAPAPVVDAVRALCRRAQVMDGLADPDPAVPVSAGEVACELRCVAAVIEVLSGTAVGVPGGRPEPAAEPRPTP